jgi:hypothetical protein
LKDISEKLRGASPEPHLSGSEERIQKLANSCYHDATQLLAIIEDLKGRAKAPKSSREHSPVF